MSIQEEIRQLAKAKNAVIMAHYYCENEVQDVADVIGDSLALAQQAAQTDADIIVMCGVHFMGETAAILCPDKKVLIPDASAGCSLADSCSAAELAQFKQQHPQAQIISYVNTSAAVKALTDVVVTSSNALKIVNQMPEDAELLFGPDAHLGAYINEQTHRQMMLWHGGCHVHSRFSAQQLMAIKAQYPQAPVLAHPECGKDILDRSDVIGSTQALLTYVQQHPEIPAFVIATEPGVIHKMQQAHPKAQLIAVPYVDENGMVRCNQCEYMRLNTLKKLRDCLRDEAPQVTVAPDIAARAIQPIQRMLAMS